MLKTALSLTLLFCSTVDSALAHKGPASSEEMALISKAKVLVIIEQEKAEAGFEVSKIGANYGLIGMTIDALDNSSRLKKMNAALAPLQEAVADLNFRRDFVAQLKGLKAFDSSRIEVMTKMPESKAAMLKLLSSTEGPVVLIDAHTVLAPNTYRALIIEVALSLWDGTKKTPLHSLGVTHISDPVTLSQTWYQNHVNLPALANNHGRLYRAAYAEGIAGSIDVLKKAFQLAPLAGKKREGRVDYTEMMVMKPNTYGIVAEETSDRVLMIDGQTVVSIPIVKSFAERKQDIRQAKSSVARVYFYRTGVSDTFFVEPAIYANGSKLGELYSHTGVYIDLMPGKYSFRIKYDGDSPSASVARSQFESVAPVEIDVVPGSEYFIRYDGYKGVWTKNDILKNIEPATARVELEPLWPVWW